jgi:hypothetical protein
MDYSYFTNCQLDVLQAYAKGLVRQCGDKGDEERSVLDIVVEYSGDIEVKQLYRNEYIAMVLSRDSCIEVVNVVDLTKNEIVDSFEIKS